MVRRIQDRAPALGIRLHLTRGVPDAKPHARDRDFCGLRASVQNCKPAGGFWFNTALIVGKGQEHLCWPTPHGRPKIGPCQCAFRVRYGYRKCTLGGTQTVIRSVVLAVLLCFAIATGRVSAQGSISNMLDDLGLSKEDYRLLRSAAESLYTSDEPFVGMSTSWKNSKSGSYGTVELTKVEDRCVSIKHLFHIGSRNAEAQHLSRRCRSSDGRWLLAPK